MTITPDGGAALQRAIPVLGAINTPRSMGLTEAEASLLNALLRKVIGASSCEAIDASHNGRTAAISLTDTCAGERAQRCGRKFSRRG